MLSDAPVGEEPVRGRDTAAWQPPATPEEGNLLPSPQPGTASFPMRIQADHDAFVTLPESPAGRPQAQTPGFLMGAALCRHRAADAGGRR